MDASQVRLFDFVASSDLLRTTVALRMSSATHSAQLPGGREALLMEGSVWSRRGRRAAGWKSCTGMCRGQGRNCSGIEVNDRRGKRHASDHFILRTASARTKEQTWWLLARHLVCDI